MNDVYIDKGKIAGKGVYAARDFKKDDIVIQYKLIPSNKGVSMTTINIGNKEFELRPADPDQDLKWAYALFKQTIKKFIEELAGKWPEKMQYDFFCKGFCNMPVQILMHGGVPVGFYGIVEEEKRVTVQRMYITPEWHGAGIGSWIIDEALKKAHMTHKPFETEVLANNIPAISFYQHNGFNIVGADNYGWVKQHIIRHQDTEQYCSERTDPAQIQRST